MLLAGMARARRAAPRSVCGAAAALRARRAASQASQRKAVFFDMVHSNNAARVRLWLALKGGGVSEQVESRFVTYPDLETDEFKAVNPLKKVPALIRADGETVAESAVILDFLEDKYAAVGQPMKPRTPEGRQEMNFLIRLHDIYVASPNCTAPGFSHSQGAMYLSYGFHGAARGMNLGTRAAKMAELWKQLNALEAIATRQPSSQYLAGGMLTLADMTWFPTCVFFEYMLPRIFKWPELFDTSATSRTPFPALAAWYSQLREQPAFAAVHRDIWGHWTRMEAAGQFVPILQELASPEARGLKFTFGTLPRTVHMPYQKVRVQ